MHKITKIEVQKNNKDRFNLYIDNNFFAGIDAATYVFYNLKKGQELTDDMLQAIGDYDNYRRAINLALNYLSYKKRTEQEVRQYLNKAEVSENHIHQTIDYCIKNQYINHEDYCLSYMNTLLNTTDKGPNHFEAELKSLGVEHDLIEKYKAKFIDAIDAERIAKIAQKVQKKYGHKLSQRMLEQKLMQTFYQKGYNFDIVSDYLSDVFVEQQDGVLMTQLEKSVTKLSRKYTGKALYQKVIEQMMRKGFQFDQIQSALKESGMEDE